MNSSLGVLEFIAVMVGILAWPAVVLTIAVVIHLDTKRDGNA